MAVDIPIHIQGIAVRVDHREVHRELVAGREPDVVEGTEDRRHGVQHFHIIDVPVDERLRRIRGDLKRDPELVLRPDHG